MKDGDVTAIEDINAIRENYDILGLFRADAKEFLKKYDKADAEDNVSVPEEIFALAEKRKAAKAEKNYALADEIRKEIADKGFILVDTKDGFTIKRHNEKGRARKPRPFLLRKIIDYINLLRL